MTYIDRRATENLANRLYHQIGMAREEFQRQFPDDGRREIPQALAVFEALEAAMQATRNLRAIFEGNGAHTVADFMPDDTGFSVNDRQMNPDCDKPWFV